MTDNRTGEPIRGVPGIFAVGISYITRRIQGYGMLRYKENLIHCFEYRSTQYKYP